MIGILDYGVGNLGSIQNMLNYLGLRNQIVSQDTQLFSSHSLILPGVGAFGCASTYLRAADWFPSFVSYSDRIPVLGICLGMQLLASASEEGDGAGLGIIPGQVIHLKSLGRSGIKVPNMGWLALRKTLDHPAFCELPTDSRFYFLHSYCFKPEVESHVFATSNCGVDFPAVVGRKNYLGVQFHPEKSHKFGMALFKGFAKWSNLINEFSINSVSTT